MNRRFTLVSRALTTLGLLGALLHCSSGDSGSDEGSQNATAKPSPGAGTADDISDFKEVVVVDSAIVLDDRAKNSSCGAWSFCHLVSEMAPEGAINDGVDEKDFVLSWLKTFHGKNADGSPITIGKFALPDRDGVDKTIKDWAKKDGHLDLKQAPYRLLAIVNRLDLDTAPNGEGRLVFGKYDPSGALTARGESMSVIFEYRLPTSLSATEWATKWHKLGQFKQFDDAYKTALQDITDGFTKRGADAARPNGNSINQVRTNELVWGDPWSIREFNLTAAGLVPVTTKQTPDMSLNKSAELKKWVLENSKDILAHTQVVPDEFLGGDAPEVFPAGSDSKWAFDGVDEKVREAFAADTCNGCHHDESMRHPLGTPGNPAGAVFYHVNPELAIKAGGDGTDRLSNFVKKDDMPQRKLVMQAYAKGTKPPKKPGGATN